MRCFLYILSALMTSLTIRAQAADYQNNETYAKLRGDMTRAFNEAESASFYPALKKCRTISWRKTTCTATTHSDATKSSS